MKATKIFKTGCLGIVALGLAGLCLGLYVWKGGSPTNPERYATIGDIPTPRGYKRIASDNGFAQYLRSLPLKDRGSKVMLYTGGEANFQALAYAVVDLPLLSNAEQCADVCMRLRAEYLFCAGKYGSIHFNDVNGRRMSYGGGKSRKAFERYLQRVYGSASTFSLSRELPTRKLKDMQPGDVFVYAAGDHDIEREMKSKYGHAIMVVDVAEDNNGNKVYMLAEGNTPARDIHVISNWRNPFSSPWFHLDETAETLWMDFFYYKADELKRFD